MKLSSYKTDICISGCHMEKSINLVYLQHGLKLAQHAVRSAGPLSELSQESELAANAQQWI
jgi:hypothetical protein